MEIPNILVHYSRSEPFRSISSVPECELSTVIKELNETNSWGRARFSDPEYLVRRRQVEQRIRRAFIAKGGVLRFFSLHGGRAPKIR
jgi:hypothetical protein